MNKYKEKILEILYWKDEYGTNDEIGRSIEKLLFEDANPAKLIIAMTQDKQRLRTALKLLEEIYND
jgi:hypothetical protein